jgi:hypothetical protein
VKLLENDALIGSVPIQIVARVQHKWENPTAPSPLYRNCSRYRTVADRLQTSRSLPRCCGSILCSIRFGIIRASKNSPSRPRRNKFVEAAVPAAFLNFAGGTPATTGLTHSPQSSRLSADGLVMTEPAFPHEARPHPREQEPASLDASACTSSGPFNRPSAAISAIKAVFSTRFAHGKFCVERDRVSLLSSGTG